MQTIETVTGQDGITSAVRFEYTEGSDKKHEYSVELNVDKDSSKKLKKG